MKVNEAVKAIACSYPSRQPLMLWGPPGVGKSSGVKKAAVVIDEMLKLHQKKKVHDAFRLIDLRLPLLESIDLRGLPYVDQKTGVSNWSRPVFLPTDGAGILFLDELVQASPSMQAAASQLILDRRIGEYVLPAGWHVIAAGNRASDRAAVNAMPTHIANRFVHLTIDVNVEAWVAWALEAKLDIRVIAWIKWKGAKALHDFDPQAKALAFPTPRSWEFVSKLLASFTDVHDPLLATMIGGAVGDGAVAEFLAFCKMYSKLPSIDAIFLNPKKAPIPTEVGVLWAVVTSISSRATPDNLDKIVIYFNRITDEAGRPEFSVAAMKEMAIRDLDKPEMQRITQTPAFIAWASKHNEMIV